jgi:hypothetical protein
MIRLHKKASITPEKAIEKAVDFFGPKGYGLKVYDQGPTCVKFEGSGGDVEVTSCAEDKGSSVEIVSNEWEIQAREFMSKIY